MEMWIWFGLAIALFVIELATTDLVAVWFALSALVLGVLASIFSTWDIVWQILTFVVLSAVLVALTRPFVKKLMKKRKDQETNLELVVNHSARVVEKIDNDLETGAVKINGLVWTARSEDGSVIEEDALVTVKEIKGNKVIVTKME